MSRYCSESARLLLAVAALAVLWCMPAGAGGHSGSAEELTVDSALQASQRAGESTNYVFSAIAGGVHLIELQQRGLDFFVAVQGPDGRTRRYSSPLRRDERELVLIEAAEKGDYLLTIGSHEPTNARGAYTIRLVEIPIQSHEDRRYVDAIRLMSEGAELYDAEDREASLDALARYRSAIEVWQQLKQIRGLAHAEYCVATLEYLAAYDWARSAEIAAAAAERYASLGLESWSAGATQLQAMALIEKANELPSAEAQATFADALELFESARETYERLNNRFELGRLRNNVGLTYFYTGDWEHARDAWARAAQDFRVLGEWREELNVRQNDAVIDGLQGYSARAIETLRYIVDSIPERHDPMFRLTVLDNLAENHRRFGDYEAALQAYTDAREGHARLGDDIGEAYSLTGIGNTYFSIGELDLAKRYLQLALPIAQATNDGRSQEAILARLGDIEFLQSNYSAAADFHRQALALVASNADRAHRLLPLAKDLTALLELEEALRLAREAQELASESEAIVTEADAEVQIGRIEIERQNPEIALAILERAYETYTLLGLKGGQADALNGLATATLAMRELDRATGYAQASVEAIEQLRERVASPELRAHYGAVSRRYYDTQIEILMKRSSTAEADSAKFISSALTTSEGARARLTIDLLSEASVSLRSRADPEVLEKERALLEELAARAQQRDQLLKQRSIGADVRQNIVALDQAMTDLESRLHVVRTEIRRKDPAYLQIASTDTADAAGLQAALGPNTALLQYSLADDKGFAWAVTRDAVTAIELVGLKKIELAARDALDRMREVDSSPDARRALDRASRTLAELVLWPMLPYVGDAQRLLIVPDGPLEYVPFAALPVSSGTDAALLIREFEIITVPSISVVEALRARGPVASPQTIAVFADPVMDEEDPRLDVNTARTSDAPPTDSIPLLRSVDSLGRLPWTAAEARTIADIVPEPDRFIAVGFAANRRQVLDMDLSRFRFLHFATHGVVDARYPALSSLVLSRFAESGEAQEGLLRLYDIFDLQLNAQLVALSACDTALGRQIRGEGLIGLAQGFMYAGARTLLVSLWQVPDRATAELMGVFYKEMLRTEHAVSPAAALREAQLALLENRRWRHPFYWAAFVTLGDWN